MANEREAPKHEVRREPRAVRVFRTCFPLLVVLWALLVLYPNPLRLAASVRRLANPGVDPVAVESLAASLPSDPAAIERAVLETLPYRYDWRVYGMPWYFPTVGEALENGEGDCKARAIVLASVLEAKGIPYRIDSSPTHVWVDYDGKVDNFLGQGSMK
jgi:transglutaminase-like putative cysteine protease